MSYFPKSCASRSFAKTTVQPKSWPSWWVDGSATRTANCHLHSANVRFPPPKGLRVSIKTEPFLIRRLQNLTRSREEDEDDREVQLLVFIIRMNYWLKQSWEVSFCSVVNVVVVAFILYHLMIRIFRLTQFTLGFEQAVWMYAIGLCTYIWIWFY